MLKIAFMRYFLFSFLGCFTWCFLATNTALALDQYQESQLNNLAKSIHLAEHQTKTINNKITILEEQKNHLQDGIDVRFYHLTKLYHQLELYKKSPDRYGYILPNQSFYDYYYNIRYYQSMQDILGHQLQTMSVDMFDLQDKITAINIHLDQRQSLFLTIQNHINALKVIKDTRESNAEFETIIKDLRLKTNSLDGFLTSVLQIIPTPIEQSFKPLDFATPISGIIRQAKPPHQIGIEIESLSGGLVSSPESGEILYAGPFLNLGAIIIINHGQGYISVLKNLNDIFIKVGDDVKKNTPIATLPVKNNDKDGNTSVLYYELRYNDSVINPLEKITGF